MVDHILSVLLEVSLIQLLSVTVTDEGFNVIIPSMGLHITLIFKTTHQQAHCCIVPSRKSMYNLHFNS